MKCLNCVWWQTFWTSWLTIKTEKEYKNLWQYFHAIQFAETRNIGYNVFSIYNLSIAGIIQLNNIWRAFHLHYLIRTNQFLENTLILKFHFLFRFLDSSIENAHQVAAEIDSNTVVFWNLL